MTTDEIEARRQAAMDEETVYEDYWGFAESVRHVLPDGKQWVEIAIMNEGEKRKYLNSQSRELVLNRRTDDTKLKMAPGDERFNLVMAGVRNWFMMRGAEPVPFSEPIFRRWLEMANPKIVDGIEKAIRMANPWLLNDMSVEDIDREISDLQDMRAKKVAEDEGKGVSSAK